jgi:hypothetical protein
MTSLLTGKTVTYQGQNRPYLNNLKGKVVSARTAVGAYLVQFNDESKGKVFSEYVGESYLTVVKGENTEAYNILDAQYDNLTRSLEALKSEKELLDKRVERLQQRVDGIKSAMDLLENS